MEIKSILMITDDLVPSFFHFEVQVINRKRRLRVTSQTFHRCISCCCLLTLQRSRKTTRHFIMCLHAAVGSKCTDLYALQMPVGVT